MHTESYFGDCNASTMFAKDRIHSFASLMRYRSLAFKKDLVRVSTSSFKHSSSPVAQSIGMEM